MRIWALFVAALALPLVPGQGGQSQSQGQATVVTPAAPEADMTTATFGDWMLRCRQNEAGKPGRTCEVVHTVMIQGQTAPFAQLALGRLAPGQPLILTAVVPVNVTFPSTLRVSLDEKDPKPFEMAWARCLPGGCFASLAVDADALARWRTQDEGGRITFKNGAGQDTAVVISFRLGRASMRWPGEVNGQVESLPVPESQVCRQVTRATEPSGLYQHISRWLRIAIPSRHEILALLVALLMALVVW
jgi:invasion protein IalB